MLNALAKALLLLCLFCVHPARAQEVEASHGLTCDSAAQLKRFVEVVGSDVSAAVQQVNTEVNDPTACAVLPVFYVRGSVTERVKNAHGKYLIVEIIVVAVMTPVGPHRVQPTLVFALFKDNDEEA